MSTKSNGISAVAAVLAIVVAAIISFAGMYKINEKKVVQAQELSELKDKLDKKESKEQEDIFDLDSEQDEHKARIADVDKWIDMATLMPDSKTRNNFALAVVTAADDGFITTEEHAELSLKNESLGYDNANIYTREIIENINEGKPIKKYVSDTERLKRDLALSQAMAWIKLRDINSPN